MKYQWIDEYCLSKKKAVKEYKVEWEATRYLIGNKMFVLLGQDNTKKEVITLKSDPDFAVYLRGKYKDVIPGYYMNKQHWNSVYLSGNVPDDVLKDLIDKSYQLVFNSLTKKLQKEI